MELRSANLFHSDSADLAGWGTGYADEDIELEDIGPGPDGDPYSTDMHQLGRGSGLDEDPPADILSEEVSPLVSEADSGDHRVAGKSPRSQSLRGSAPTPPAPGGLLAPVWAYRKRGLALVLGFFAAVALITGLSTPYPSTGERSLAAGGTSRMEKIPWDYATGVRLLEAAHPSPGSCAGVTAVIFPGPVRPALSLDPVRWGVTRTGRFAPASGPSWPIGLDLLQGSQVDIETHIDISELANRGQPADDLASLRVTIEYLEQPLARAFLKAQPGPGAAGMAVLHRDTFRPGGPLNFNATISLVGDSRLWCRVAVEGMPPGPDTAAITVSQRFDVAARVYQHTQPWVIGQAPEPSPGQGADTLSGSDGPGPGGGGGGGSSSSSSSRSNTDDRGNGDGSTSTPSDSAEDDDAPAMDRPLSCRGCGCHAVLPNRGARPLDMYVVFVNRLPEDAVLIGPRPRPPGAPEPLPLPPGPVGVPGHQPAAFRRQVAHRAGPYAAIWSCIGLGLLLSLFIMWHTAMPPPPLPPSPPTPPPGPVSGRPGSRASKQPGDSDDGPDLESDPEGGWPPGAVVKTPRGPRPSLGPGSGRLGYVSHTAAVIDAMATPGASPLLLSPGASFLPPPPPGGVRSLPSSRAQAHGLSPPIGIAIPPRHHQHSDGVGVASPPAPGTVNLPPLATADVAAGLEATHSERLHPDRADSPAWGS
ncbi:hypothetical protein H696_04324 [Fonticula alba]|uniref:Uncharacterized protein n=1 Tax=Fonticula alba TaxID=691883 RepID=A0A058Z3S3_FONAL|nr:hypothetical protein H696_04324 [Fonticula alba]KCV68905.1 hypothetical protein H696_04324 [Fonticula alba]|eukprot:XP_009496476.1 hypothetical protein H696_04324 [Fonticula alba]